MPTGNVEIAIQDGGAGVVSVAASSVQLVIGTATSGPTAAITATRSPNTLADTFTSGELVEYSAMAVKKGATVLAMRAATVSAGNVTAVVATRAAGTPSTSVVTVTGSPNDEYYVTALVTTGGTIATAGIKFKVSIDGGRNYGPTLALGTANTYIINGTGLTLDFGAGTLHAGDFFNFSTTPPTWDTGAVEACLNTFKASQYAANGIGSMHIVGVMSGAHAATIGSDMDSLAAGFIYSRAICAARDVAVPTAWGGPGIETETTWVSAMGTEYSAVDAKRICVAGGNYNMPSVYPNSVAGSPAYRRNLAWALAVRQVQIQPQRHAGRVRDGSLSNIVIDPTNDPSDGFVYHDERINPGLDDARLASARTRIGKNGFYIVQPRLMAAAGSQFSLIPFGNVMDIACSIVNQVGQDEINDDITLNDNGTIYENEAQRIEAVLKGAIDANMTNKKMISSVTIVVDRTSNVLATDEVNIEVTIVRRGYILQENVTIGFKNPFAG